MKAEIRRAAGGSSDEERMRLMTWAEATGGLAAATNAKRTCASFEAVALSPSSARGLGFSVSYPLHQEGAISAHFASTRPASPTNLDERFRLNARSSASLHS